MNPLPDRTVIIGMVATLGLVFALVFWFVRLSPSQTPPLQWRDTDPRRPRRHDAIALSLPARDPQLALRRTADQALVGLVMLRSNPHSNRVPQKKLS